MIKKILRKSKKEFKRSKKTVKNVRTVVKNTKPLFKSVGKLFGDELGSSLNRAKDPENAEIISKIFAGG